uniref:regucalcin-like n=1 Tax=Styela clava TaxID=7725 RepID=UPI0019396FB2|nr:regucalcin-like [Styela clava]
MTHNVDIVSEYSSVLGEGPHWDDIKQRLLFVDITRSAIHRWDYATGKLQEAIVLEEPTIGAVVPREKGGFIAAAANKFLLVDEGTGKAETICQPTDNVKSRFNDGKCDPRGRFWAGTMGLEDIPAHPIPKQGEMYVLDTDLSVSTKMTNLDISNGLAWTKDATKMFYIDSLTYQVTSYNYDISDGSIANKQKVVDFILAEDGTPDGQCIDCDGNLWVAMFSTGIIIKIDTTRGEKVERIKISDTALKTTSCCFGGPNFDELFVTSALNGDYELNKGQKVGDSGRLFRVRGLGVNGSPAVAFKG